MRYGCFVNPGTNALLALQGQCAGRSAVSVSDLLRNPLNRGQHGETMRLDTLARRRGAEVGFSIFVDGKAPSTKIALIE